VIPATTVPALAAAALGASQRTAAASFPRECDPRSEVVLAVVVPVAEDVAEVELVADDGDEPVIRSSSGPASTRWPKSYPGGPRVARS
jgi:hypothetical protein